MKAPDKIYIPIIEEDGKRLLCTIWWETDTSSHNAYVNETIPYIRKDALLEWAGGELMPGNSAEGKGWNLALQTLIDKLNEM